MRTWQIPDPYPGQSVEWLRGQLAVIFDSDGSASGAQTHVAIAPGMFDEFAEVKSDDLERKKKKLIYALWLREEDGFYNPYERASQTIPIFKR